MEPGGSMPHSQGLSNNSFPELLKIVTKNILIKSRPCGKENIEVRISQNKGKESENSYQKLKRSL